ncbi:MAG TPA: lipoprotein [Spongiibacteraceae bacterium]|nr:lipoprotein [Spongiibacteraceae bacterium]
MRTALVAAVLCALLCGCGQKGPLFIPDDNSAPPSTTRSQVTQP